MRTAHSAPAELEILPHVEPAASTYAWELRNCRKAVLLLISAGEQ